jgi:hypothetical protein
MLHLRTHTQGSGGFALRLPGSGRDSGDGDEEYENYGSEGLGMYQRGSRLQGGLVLGSEAGTDHLVVYAPPPQPPKRTCRVCCGNLMMRWVL